MLIQFTIAIQKRKWHWSLHSDNSRTITQIIKESLPKTEKSKGRELPAEFSTRDYYSGRVLSHYRSTYHEADIWWIQGYPEDEGSFIVVVEPYADGNKVPSRVDDLTLRVFSEIESRIPSQLILKTNRLEYKQVSQVFSVVQPKVTLWMPETIAFILASLLFGAAVSGLRYRAPAEGNHVLVTQTLNILIGVLGSSISAFLVAFCAWLVRRKNAKLGRKVVYQDAQ